MAALSLLIASSMSAGTKLLRSRASDVSSVVESIGWVAMVRRSGIDGLLPAPAPARSLLAESKTGFTFDPESCKLSKRL